MNWKAECLVFHRMRWLSEKKMSDCLVYLSNLVCLAAGCHEANSCTFIQTKLEDC